jgi:hypothetical protein
MPHFHLFTGPTWPGFEQGPPRWEVGYVTTLYTGSGSPATVSLHLSGFVPAECRYVGVATIPLSYSEGSGFKSRVETVLTKDFRGFLSPST